MSKIEFESLSPNIIVNDVNKTVEYYTQKLGFTLAASVPDSGIFNWAMVMHDNVTIMFQSLSSIQEDLPSLKFNSSGSMGTFYIKVKGVDVLYASLKMSADIVVEMRKTFYGAREFAIKDLNGHFLMFAEDVA